jgi:hypothetical protein
MVSGCSQILELKGQPNGSQKHEKIQEYEVAQEGQEVGSYQAPCRLELQSAVTAKHEQRSTVLRAHKACFSALWPADRQVSHP